MYLLWPKKKCIYKIHKQGLTHFDLYLLGLDWDDYFYKTIEMDRKKRIKFSNLNLIILNRFRVSHKIFNQFWQLSCMLLILSNHLDLSKCHFLFLLNLVIWMDFYPLGGLWNFRKITQNNVIAEGKWYMDKFNLLTIMPTNS